MALVVDAFEEKKLRHYEPYWSKLKVKSRRVEGYYHGLKWATWFL